MSGCLFDRWLSLSISCFRSVLSTNTDQPHVLPLMLRERGHISTVSVIKGRVAHAVERCHLVITGKAPILELPLLPEVGGDVGKSVLLSFPLFCQAARVRREFCLDVVFLIWHECFEMAQIFLPTASRRQKLGDEVERINNNAMFTK
ncbi:hypothetical protein CEXT_330111 [Caerostris extrusa]|uniref:Secreted protein n=1 Tax=Caerostris extrusa TaxID=172846 RepID=A0AAV4N1H9_CAEEX|nr:hypothetical protein CEXT_330111 [Caerostris extrusa]